MIITHLGKPIRLTAGFKDRLGNLIDPFTPFIDLIKPDGTTYLARQIPIREDEGVYFYEWNVPSAIDIGIWIIRWSCNIEGFNIVKDYEFEVVPVSSINVGVSRWLPNNIYEVLVNGNIKSLDGEVLGESQEFTFNYKYDPFFTEIETVRHYAGNLANDLSDDYISMMIYDNSVNALRILKEYKDSGRVWDYRVLPLGPVYNPNLEFYEQAVGRPLECYTRWKTIEDVITGKLPDLIGSLGSKQLGDFSISKFGKDVDAWDKLLNGVIRPKLEYCYSIISGLALGQVDSQSTIKSSTGVALRKSESFRAISTSRTGGRRW